ncbi:MAG: hypothetical protein WCJ26_11765 [bacterium]
MSNPCSKYNPEEIEGCSCDLFIHPKKLSIAAGLTTIPRQIAVFHEFRNAMLAALHDPDKAALASWRTREEDDLGIMLLEMWAYICDSLSFYDEVIAHETFLRTARQKDSVRKLVNLLGYLPMPAVASTVDLAALADGRIPVELPKGTSFRSGGFGKEPPQVFELDQKTIIHPFSNSWNVEPPKIGKTREDARDFLLVKPATEIKKGTILLICHPGDPDLNEVAEVKNVESYKCADNTFCKRLNFTSATNLKKGSDLSRINLMTPLKTASLWTEIEVDGKETLNAALKSQLTLDALYKDIKTGTYLVLGQEENYRWYKANNVSTVLQTVNTGNSITINTVSYDMADIKTQVTRITLDVSVNDLQRFGHRVSPWDDAKKIIVYYHLEHAGEIVEEAKTSILPEDTVKCEGVLEKPPDKLVPGTFLIRDYNETAIKAGGTLNYVNKEFSFPGKSWQNELTLPVNIYGNIVRAIRGETVENEILGGGNASEVNQSFKLKKKPLTYLFSPAFENDTGVISSLKIFVNGIEWREVPGFFGKTPFDQVYIIRQDDNQESWVKFGDGVRGARVPTGTGNIVAYYRFGAGAAAPPAGSVTQVAKPVQGLKSIVNPIPASGGADAESRDDIQRHAPGSILILGRAVSIIDMEAVASSVPGVRNVIAEWRWQKTKQNAMVHITYIGEAGIEEKISERLRNVSDPSVSIDVSRAKGIKTDLSVQIERDPRYQKDKIWDEVYAKLFEPAKGFLVPEKLPLAKPLYRSTLFKIIHEVPGVISVQDITWNGARFNLKAQMAEPGKYFDFESGQVDIYVSE